MITHPSQATQPVTPLNDNSETLLQENRVAVLLAGYGEVESYGSSVLSMLIY